MQIPSTPATPVRLAPLSAWVVLSGALGCAAAGPPIELVPTSPAVLETCASELGRTYCSADEAAAAASACNARLSDAQRADCDPTRACLVPYAPTRTGACTAGPTYPSIAACSAPVADNCAFYRSCLEAAHPCGASGYALGFGEPLCYLFVDHRAEFTPAGQAWLAGVRTCLQKSLAPLVSRDTGSCDALADTAYASHTSCYTAVDNSFCKLPPEDVNALTALLLPYLRDPRVSAQVQAVATICAHH